MSRRNRGGYKVTFRDFLEELMWIAVILVLTYFAVNFAWYTLGVYLTIY